MRIIGHLPDEASARRFNDFLYVEGISGVIEPDKGDWAVWVHSEDQLERATELLGQFVTNPSDPRFQKGARRARQLREEAAMEEAQAEKRLVGHDRIFRGVSGYSVGWLTITLIALCLGIAWLTQLGKNVELKHALQIAEPFRSGILPEVQHGQVWRLLTPIFLHFTWYHLLFNLMWLFDLGTMIEGRQGAGRLALLVVLIGVVSNLGQYFVSGPNFGGMSGVVYGLLGYVWMRGKFDPASGLFLHPTTVTMMLAWFFLCLTGTVGPIANTVHAVGLITGLLWGYLSSRPMRLGR